MASKFKGLMKKPGEIPPEAPAAEVNAPPPEVKRMGRPPGKRTNPDYDQFSVLLKKETHKRVRSYLVLREEEFSELVQGLLETWLTEQQAMFGEVVARKI